MLVLAWRLSCGPISLDTEHAKDALNEQLDTLARLYFRVMSST